MAKKRIYLTDITLHVRGHRQTVNFSKIAQKGRMYSPVANDHVKSNPSPTDDGFKFAFQFPPDLQQGIDRGEVELMMPEGGLPMYAGKDVQELMEKMNRKQRRQLIHRGRTWHTNK